MDAKRPVKLTMGLKAAPPSAMAFLYKGGLPLLPTPGPVPTASNVAEAPPLDVMAQLSSPPGPTWWATKPAATPTEPDPLIVFTGDDRYTYLHERMLAVCCQEFIVPTTKSTLDTVLIEMQDSLGSEQRIIAFIAKQWRATANIYDDGSITHYLAQMYNGLNVMAFDSVQVPVFLYPTPDMLKAIMTAPVKPRRIVVVVDDAYVNDPIVRKFRLASQVIHVPRFGTYVMNASFALVVKLLKLQHAQQYEYIRDMANSDPRWMLNALYFSAVDTLHSDDNLMSMSQPNWLHVAKQYLLHGAHDLIMWHCRAAEKDVRAQFHKVTPSAKGGFIVQALTSLSLTTRMRLCMTPLPTPPVVDNASLEKYLHVTCLPAVHALTQAFVTKPESALDLCADMLDIYSDSDVSGSLARDHMQKSALYLVRQRHQWPAYGTFARPQDLDSTYFTHLRKYGMRRAERKPVFFWTVTCTLPHKTVYDTAILYMAAALQDEPCCVYRGLVPLLNEGEWDPKHIWQNVLQPVAHEAALDTAKRRQMEPLCNKVWMLEEDEWTVDNVWHYLYPTADETTRGMDTKAAPSMAWMLAINYFMRVMGPRPPAWTVVLDKLQTMLSTAARIKVPDVAPPAEATDMDFVCNECVYMGSTKDGWKCWVCTERTKAVRALQGRLLKIT